MMSGTAASFTLSSISDVLWTLTDRCNLNCVYCSVVPHGGPLPQEPSRAEIDRIIDQLSRLPKLESLILSGGEALLSRHLDYILTRAARVASVRYLITNGTVMNPRRREVLLKQQPRVMVSIDSLVESVNASTRGTGILEKALQTVRWLLDSGFFTIVIIVLTRNNMPTLGRTLTGLYDLGVRNVLIQQLHCSDHKLRTFFKKNSPSHEDIRKLTAYLEEFRATRPDAVIDDNEICFFEHRAALKRQKCDSDKSYYPQRLFQCGAGFNFFAIKANGDIIPCNAFLDCVAGNIHKDPLTFILTRSQEMVGLRNLREYRVDCIPGCRQCGLNVICDGGCRADVYNSTGEIGNPHPYCPWNKGQAVGS